MKHTAEEVLEKWKEHRHGNRLDTLKSPADIMRPKDRRAFLDCYDALAGLRPEAVREMREALKDCASLLNRLRLGTRIDPDMRDNIRDVEAAARAVLAEQEE